MSLIAGIGALHEALDYHVARHNLLTSNLAQVDTPGYKARDLKRVSGDFSEVLQVQMDATHTRHLEGSVRPANWSVEEDRFAPVKADGNGVSLDREAVKISANNLRYEAITTLMSAELGIYDWAARDAR